MSALLAPLALSLIRSSGETRAHRSPSARPAFLTVCRLLYSNDSFHSFSSAEFRSAYLTLWVLTTRVCPTKPRLQTEPVPFRFNSAETKAKHQLIPPAKVACPHSVPKNWLQGRSFPSGSHNSPSAPPATKPLIYWHLEKYVPIRVSGIRFRGLSRHPAEPPDETLRP